MSQKMKSGYGLALLVGVAIAPLGQWISGKINPASDQPNGNLVEKVRAVCRDAFFDSDLYEMRVDVSGPALTGRYETVTVILRNQEHGVDDQFTYHDSPLANELSIMTPGDSWSVETRDIVDRAVLRALGVDDLPYVKPVNYGCIGQDDHHKFLRATDSGRMWICDETDYLRKFTTIPEEQASRAIANDIRDGLCAVMKYSQYCQGTITYQLFGD